MIAPFAFENPLYQHGFKFIAGVDEVGRGCIAGPVVACAVIVKPDTFLVADQMKDSKVLSEKKREMLYPLIMEQAVSVGVGSVDQQTIDQINILQASLLAMKKAVEALTVSPDLCLVDGNQKIPFSLPQQTVIQGDQKVTCISAASIVAKVYRDRWMKNEALSYPQYNFEKNKGYGTLQHRKAIAEYGFCDLHRKSFSVCL